MKLLSAAVILAFCISGGHVGAQEIAALSSSSSSDSLSAASSSAVVATEQRLPISASVYQGRIRPFSKIAIGTRLGTLGWGAQVATPLTNHLNLRGSATFFAYGYGTEIDGARYNADLRLRSGLISVDYYPFHSGFHLSPGLLIFKSGASATMSVSGGSSFSLGEADYTSDSSDPVHGSGTFSFGRTVMPSLTIGFGNVISKRENSHWSVPVDFGLAYTGQNSLQLGLGGSACQQGGCMSVSDPGVQQNVVQEQNEINESIKRFKIYPIITSGVTYRF